MAAVTTSSDTGPSRLRADAQRNREEIRKAAFDVFRDRGLGTPLEDVARLAGVSKGTIYHRFGGRQGLIDAVVDDLVGECIDGIIARVEALTDPLERFEQYLRQTWLLQYDEPAANDVLVRTLPGSHQLTALCERARRFGRRLLEDAQAAGGVRDDITPDDVYQLILERGLVVHAGGPQARADYERRLDVVLRGLRR